MKPLVPSQISIGRDGRLKVDNPFWEREAAASGSIVPLSTNGSCTNYSCRGSTNTRICENYNACNGSRNGTCLINNQEEEPIDP